MRAKFAKKYILKRLFLTKFEFSVLIFVKKVKKPTLMGEKICHLIVLWVLLGPVKLHLYGYKIFDKQGLLGGISVET